MLGLRLIDAIAAGVLQVFGVCCARARRFSSISAITFYSGAGCPVLMGAGDPRGARGQRERPSRSLFTIRATGPSSDRHPA